MEFCSWFQSRQPWLSPWLANSKLHELYEATADRTHLRISSEEAHKYQQTLLATKTTKQNPYHMRCTSLVPDRVWQRSLVTLGKTKQNKTSIYGFHSIVTTIMSQICVKEHRMKAKSIMSTLFQSGEVSWRERSFRVNAKDINQELLLTLRLNFLSRPSWCILVTEHCSSDLQTCKEDCDNGHERNYVMNTTCLLFCDN